MKILYVTTIGMTMRFFESFIEELIKGGHQVDIATNDDPECGGHPVPDKYKELGCKIYHIDCQRNPFSTATFKAIKQLKELVASEEYDIVHCHTPVAGVCTRLACKDIRKERKKSDRPIRVFYTAHGFHFYKGAPKKNWIIYYPIEKICAKWTDTLITINKEDYSLAKNKFEGLGKSKQFEGCKVEYIPGVGVDVDKFANTVVDRKAKRAELGIPEDAFLLLSVGELNENKNHQIVLKALAELKKTDEWQKKNYYYIIAGTGPLRQQLQDMIRALNLNDRVFLLGQRADCAELYKIANLFVHPSLREGLPVSVMEALAVGLPVVGSDIRGNRDLIPYANLFGSINDKEVLKILQNNNCDKTCDIRGVSKNNINRNIKHLYDNT